MTRKDVIYRFDAKGGNVERLIPCKVIYIAILEGRKSSSMPPEGLSDEELQKWLKKEQAKLEKGWEEIEKYVEEWEGSSMQ